MLIKHAQKEALKQINTTFKLSEIGYGQGFHEGQMQERKYWKDKIKAKIEDILNSENSEAIEKLIEWQSLLEKEDSNNDKKRIFRNCFKISC